MSIKIYNGFEITTGSIQEVYRVVETFREVLKLKAEALMDAYAVNPINQPDWYSKWNQDRKMAKDLGGRWVAFDTDFSITIIPHNGVFYGIAYTVQENWFDSWLTMPLVKPFQYWNNSDPDEDVPDYQWEFRKKTWDEIFASEQALLPCMRGFSIDIMDPNGPSPKGWMSNADHGKVSE